MNRKPFVYCLYLFIAVFAFSCKQQENTPSVAFNVGKGQYVLTALTPDIIQVTYADSLVSGDQIVAPVDLPTAGFTSVKNNTNASILTTENLKITISTSPFSIVYEDLKTGQKLREKTQNTRRGDSLYFDFELEEKESIYGTGFRALTMNRRGEELLVYNRPQYGYGWGEKNLNYTFPHWLSSRDFMVLVDNPARALLDIGKNDPTTLSYKTAAGNMAYYFINGDGFESLMKNYQTLTGRQPLPPRWAMGHLQSRFGYRNQQQAIDMLDKALSAGYPVDAIILDIYWFGPELEDGQMGRLEWDLDQWPDPRGMIKYFKSKGVKTILVTEPFFTKKSSHFKFLSENQLLALDSSGKTATIPDFYFGEAGILDIFKPEARDWMWQQYRYLKSFGIDGWWVDLGEPEKHPDYMQHVNGHAAEVHGAFGHEWAKMLHDGLADDFPEERLFHLGRAGFAGTHRYGIIPWTGDVNRGWSGLRAQVPAILSMGLSGLAYMHSDAGGFSMAEKPDPELYTRWLQLATFSPIFRPHADEAIAPEPVFWDETTQQIVKKYIDLRYALLPYHYTMAWQHHTSGMPMARPVFSIEPDVPDTLDQQFLWGDAFLIAPVIDPGRKIRPVYLPEGEWYNFWSGQLIPGPQVVHMGVNLEDIPVFVRAGSFVPMAENITNAGNYTGDQLSFQYYVSSAPSESSVYFDDGSSRDYLIKDAYALVVVAAQPTAKGIRFTFEQKGTGFPEMPASQRVNLLIIGWEKAPSRVDDLPFTWDETKKELLISFEWPFEGDREESKEIFVVY